MQQHEQATLVATSTEIVHQEETIVRVVPVWASPPNLALLAMLGEVRADSAAALDWGRRRMAHLLRPRDFGDLDAEAVVMVAFLGTFGARRTPATIDAAAHVIECGLLGR